MPLTNADYLANPQQPPADPERAQRLEKFVRQRRIGASLIKPAALLLVVCAAWVAWALWLAFQGSPFMPSFGQMLWPSLGALILGMVIAITRAVSFTTGPYWEPSRSIPRELASPPRRVIVPRMPIGRLFVGIAIMFTIAIAGLTVREVRDAMLLQREGVETTGTVIRRTVQTGKSKRYFVTYRYSARGAVLQRSGNVRQSEYERMSEGATTPVTYGAMNPSISEPRSRAEASSPLRVLTPLLATAGSMLVLAVLMTFLMSYIATQTEAIATRGVAVVARVTKVGHAGVQYSYDTPHGVIDARYSWGKQKPAPTPVEGETYVVLYDPDTPRRSMPLATLQDVRFL